MHVELKRLWVQAFTPAEDMCWLYSVFAILYTKRFFNNLVWEAVII